MRPYVHTAKVRKGCTLEESAKEGDGRKIERKGKRRKKDRGSDKVHPVMKQRLGISYQRNPTLTRSKQRCIDLHFHPVYPSSDTIRNAKRSKQFSILRFNSPASPSLRSIDRPSANMRRNTFAVFLDRGVVNFGFIAVHRRRRIELKIIHARIESACMFPSDLV
ncbi:hypothetical protein BYT27DRAFT_6709484 [Phlegmacium glaucopus]|nr:hypothetical protein BYT27DRAFT_6709484 [Phlegmacium glaucopus]